MPPPDYPGSTYSTVKLRKVGNSYVFTVPIGVVEMLARDGEMLPDRFLLSIARSNTGLHLVYSPIRNHAPV